MDRVSRAMSLIHDLATKLEVLWDYKAILEQQNPNSLVENIVLHPIPIFFGDAPFQHPFLSGNDIFFDGWNKDYIV
jgi:hypothetical protein